MLILVKSGRDNDLNDKGDPDNREVEYKPSLTIDSRERDNSFTGQSGESFGS